MTNQMAVLLAEDEEHDVFLMRRAFRVAGVNNPLIAVADGQEAIWYLQGQGAYADRRQYPEVCLVLLDLKMPIIDGFEVLQWVQGQAFHEALPIVVLTSSDYESDMHRAFELGADGYLLKPSDFHELVHIVSDIRRSWLEPILVGASSAQNIDPKY